jgi:membrane-bound lytic murein transglycosylase B
LEPAIQEFEHPSHLGLIEALESVKQGPQSLHRGGVAGACGGAQLMPEVVESDSA